MHMAKLTIFDLDNTLLAGDSDRAWGQYLVETKTLESDYLDKLRAICVKCGNPASFSQRLINDSEQVLIGETDIYEARCRNCFNKEEN